MAMGVLKTIDPAKVTLVVDGTVVTGFADGEYIRAELTQDQYDLRVGAYGHSIRIARAGRPGQIRIRLLPTAPILSKIRQLATDQRTFEIVCVDNNPGSDDGFVAHEAWVARDPAFVRSTDGAGNVIEVVFQTHYLVMKPTKEE